MRVQQGSHQQGAGEVMRACETCRFWKAGNTVEHIPRSGLRYGNCRRNPPVKGDFYEGWPQAFHNDWCGEHEPKESDDGR